MHKGPEAIGDILAQLMARRDLPLAQRGTFRLPGGAAGELLPLHAPGPCAGDDTRSPWPIHVGPGTSFRKPALLQTLAELLPDEKIKDLRFRVGPVG